MKKLISILGVTTMGFNSIVIPIQNISKKEEKKIEINNNAKTNEQKLQVAEQWYLKIADTNQETTFKNNLLLAISLKDNQINFDINKLNKTLWNDNAIYNLISKPEYIKNLQLMYESGNLQFIDDKPQFLENLDTYVYKGVWAESKWYWFGYWKLHVGHVETQDFIKAMIGGFGTFLRIANSILKYYGGWISIVAHVVVLLFYANAALMKALDKGNGIWLGIYGFVPDLGWGSD